MIAIAAHMQCCSTRKIVDNAQVHSRPPVCLRKTRHTYKTKLKLDKEVGGGDFSELGNCVWQNIVCTCCLETNVHTNHYIHYCMHYCIRYHIRYEVQLGTYQPPRWTVNLEMRLEVQLRTYQPPIPNASQASAWCYKYIGRWMCKTECSPTWLGYNFGSLNLT